MLPNSKWDVLCTGGSKRETLHVFIQRLNGQIYQRCEKSTNGELVPSSSLWKVLLAEFKISVCSIFNSSWTVFFRFYFKRVQTQTSSIAFQVQNVPQCTRQIWILPHNWQTDEMSVCSLLVNCMQAEHLICSSQAHDMIFKQHLHPARASILHWTTETLSSSPTTPMTSQPYQQFGDWTTNRYTADQYHCRLLLLTTSPKEESQLV